VFLVLLGCLEVGQEGVVGLHGDDLPVLCPYLPEQGEEELAPLGGLGLQVPEAGEVGETCFVGGPPGTEPGTATGLTVHQLSLGIVCQAPAEEECVTGATLHAVWAAMYGATVTLSDPTPPTLSAPSGALWGPGEAGGLHKGTENVTISAQDVGGGVQSIVLEQRKHRKMDP
jgi:hypothetical protein